MRTDIQSITGIFIGHGDAGGIDNFVIVGGERGAVGSTEEEGRKTGVWGDDCGGGGVYGG
jgi:hypothetical protein